MGLPLLGLISILLSHLTVPQEQALAIIGIITRWPFCRRLRSLGICSFTIDFDARKLAVINKIATLASVMTLSVSASISSPAPILESLQTLIKLSFLRISKWVSKISFSISSFWL